jgi:hypothetical protein
MHHSDTNKKTLGNGLKTLWSRGWLYKTGMILVCILLLLLATSYGIARWYIATEKGNQSQGVSFIADYASSLGVDPHDTMKAMINDLHVKNFRLVSYWSDMEKSPGQYNFSELDWEFHQAEAAQAKITLSVGLRQPRWPECHVPSWIDINKPVSTWQPQLEGFITRVVNRYKSSPALGSYQLENEYFLKAFGECTNFDRSRLVSEYNLIKKLDTKHIVILSRSNNAQGIPLYSPTPDEYGISIYKRVWDTSVTHRYVEYPFPAWYYATLAGLQKIVQGRDMIIHEMQAEPWPPDKKGITDISLAEQSKSFDAARFQGRINFAKATGMPTVYYWGGEYWYYRKVVLHDSSVWNVAKTAFNKPAQSTQK